MSGKGLPAGQDTGYALLDKQGITTCEFQQQVTYQRALEGELAKTLEALDGVNQAVVHLALPKDEVFVTDAGQADRVGAAGPGAGTQLSGEQIQAVTNLVSSSVEDMEPEQVTVTDSDRPGAVRPPAPGSAPAAGDARSQVETGLRGPARRPTPSRSSTGRSARPRRRLGARRRRPRPAAVDLGDLHLPERHPADVVEHDHRELHRRRRRRSAASSARRTCPTRRPTPVAATRPTTRRRPPTTTPSDKTTETVEAAPGPLNRLTVSVVMDQAVAGNLNQQPGPVPRSATPSVWTPARGDAITVAAMPFDTTAADSRPAADIEAATQAEASAPDVVDDPHRRHRGRHRAGRPPGLAALAPPAARSRRSTSRSSSPTTCSPSSTGCASPAAARSSRSIDNRRPGARGRRAAEGPGGDLHHGQRDARRGRGDAAAAG